MLALLAGTVNSEAVQQVLDNPNLSTDDEMNLITSIMGDDLSAEGRNFVGVLAEYDRLSLLPTVSEMFELLKANHEKTMEVEVTSAFEVTDAQQSELSEALQRMLQRSINLETSVDEALIGGVVIKAEDTVIDDSVRGRLQKLSQVLN